MARIGIDFGGTKIEAAALLSDGGVACRIRRPNPGGYDAAVEAVRGLVAEVEAEVGEAPVGMGVPGSLSPVTGLMRNANSVWLNGKPFKQDLETALDREVRLANDANCMALSEACDGAGADGRVVFAAILGTGCGGGVVVDQQLIEGRNGVGGEWGHTPLPWPEPDEFPGRRCWCGRINCLETWISGTGFVEDAREAGFDVDSGKPVIAALRAGDSRARAVFDRYIDRLGRALAVVGDIIDPDVIVLAGGMSNVDEIYEAVAPVVADRIFSDVFTTPIRKAVHGDSSGVRGAAWLWPAE